MESIKALILMTRDKAKESSNGIIKVTMLDIGKMTNKMAMAYG